jgi:hypothetical protein
MDNVPATPVAPAATAAMGDALKAAPTDVKVAPTTPIDKGTADNIKTETKAEASVIQKIKVGDMEYDETTLKNMIEKSKGADKRFLEAAQARKEAIRFFKMAKENPREFLEKTGLDPKKFAYDEVAKDIQEKLRDPKEVELEKAQARLKEYEAKEEAARQQFEEQRMANKAKAVEERFHQEAISALEKHPAIPRNGFSVARMAKYIETVQEKTGVLLSFEEVAGVIEKDIRSEVAGLTKGASADQLVQLIGEEGVEVIRKYLLSKIKDPLKDGKGAVGNGDSKPAPKKWGNNSHDFWKTIDQAARAEKEGR